MGSCYYLNIHNQEILKNNDVINTQFWGGVPVFGGFGPSSSPGSGGFDSTVDGRSSDPVQAGGMAVPGVPGGAMGWGSATPTPGFGVNGWWGGTSTGSSGSPGSSSSSSTGGASYASSGGSRATTNTATSDTDDEDPYPGMSAGGEYSGEYPGTPPGVWAGSGGSGADGDGGYMPSGGDDSSSAFTGPDVGASSFGFDYEAAAHAGLNTPPVGWASAGAGFSSTGGGDDDGGYPSGPDSSGSSWTGDSSGSAPSSGGPMGGMNPGASTSGS